MDEELQRLADRLGAPYIIVASLAEVVPPNEDRETFIRRRLAAYGIKKI